MASFFTSGLPFRQWITSDAGRRLSQQLMAGAVAGIGLAYYVVNTSAINKMKEWFQLYDQGITVKPPPHIVDLISETLGECGVTELDARRLRWFTAFGFEPTYFGCIGYRQGAIVGLPKPLYYRSQDDVDKRSIKIHSDKSIAWHTDAGEALLRSLVYSEEAKKFVIACEIHRASWYETTTKLLPLCMPATVFAVLSINANDRYNLFRAPLQFRMGIYTLCVVAAAVATVLAFDSVTRYYESCAVDEVARMGEDYARGGIEYFSKCLLRNRALRDMLEDEGKASYEATGEVRHWFRQPHVTFNERREICKKILPKLVEQRLNPEAAKTREEQEKAKSMEDIVKGWFSEKKAEKLPDLPVVNVEDEEAGKTVNLKAA